MNHDDDPVAWARERLEQNQHPEVTHLLREFLARFAPKKRVPRTSWGYRITVREPGEDVIEDDGWRFDDAHTWSLDQAQAAALIEVADLAEDADYLVEAALFQHGWPADLDPFDAEEILVEATEFVNDGTEECPNAEPWTKLPDGATDELNNALLEVWHSWCRKYNDVIVLSTMETSDDSTYVMIARRGDWP